MGTLVLTEFLSLDGVMQAPGGPREDTTGGFTLGGWIGPHFDEELGAAVDAGINELDVLLLGRRTYDIFAAFWPNVPDDHPDAAVARKFARVPRYVVSRTLKSADWATVLSGDVATEVARLKAETDGQIQVQGSGTLAQALMRYDLIDTYRLIIAPVVLGGGRRLFADGAVPTALRLTDGIVTAKGVAALTYRRTGEDVPILDLAQ